MYKSIQKSTNNRSFKYSFVASFSIMVFLFTFITNTAYGVTTTTVTNVAEFSDESNLLTGVAVDKSGHIYVADPSDRNIKKINISSNTTTTAAVGFECPEQLAVDSSYNIYFKDSSDDANIGRPFIYKTDIYGNTTTLERPNAPMYFIEGISVDSNDNVYIVDGQIQTIDKFDSSGNYLRSFDCTTKCARPYRAVVDSSGNIYIAYLDENENYAIVKLDSNGNFTNIGEGTFSESSYKQIAIDNNDNIYILENDIANEKNTIYKMNTSGQIEAYAFFDYSQSINGMAVDKNGNIYVIDGNRVKKITVSPELKIDTTNPPNGTAGAPYSYTFTSAGGIGEKTYALTEGSLPAGLVLSQDGILSGTPTVVGTNQFAITATDSATPPNTSSAAVRVVFKAPVYYTLTYSASYGGYISGQTTQQIKSGESGSEVTAIPNSGYIFAGWDDGVGQATRRETNVSGHKNITAVFIRQGVNPPIIPPQPPTPPAPPQPTVPQTTIPTNIVTLPPIGDTSGGSSSGSTSTSASNPAQFTATVTNAGNLNSISQLPLKINTGADNIIRGELKITGDDAQRIIDELAKQNKKTADIVVSDSGGRLSELTASMTPETIMRLIRASIGIKLSTPNGGVIIPSQAMENFLAHKGRLAGTDSTAYSDSQNDDLYFKFTEIKDTKMQEEINKRASQLLSNRNVQPLSSTVDIQTNMPYGSNVGVRFPIPTNERISPALDADLLSNTAAYTEHSNGINESQRFDRIEFVNGSPIGVIDKTDFSKFTIVRLSLKTTTEGSWENDEQGWKYIKNGGPVTGWNQIGGAWYLMGSNGIMKTGWEEVDDKWYYLNSDGTMAKNIVIDGHTLNEDGVSIN